ncbi:MAG: GNAT family N-acetyltransferase [Chloroflexi bacterium]|nr:GNAT family N-acetyltransferase [Chloroflexota bacterium]
MSEWTQGEYTISTDRNRLEIEMMHHYLANESYWAQGRPLALLETAINHSLCFGVYQGAQQIGFARVVTDCAVFAYLADVFILPAHQGHGLGKWLIQTILQAPELQNVGRLTLNTRDAHGLYAQFGFGPVTQPELSMELRRTPAWCQKDKP